jgi:hypothetical protein
MASLAKTLEDHFEQVLRDSGTRIAHGHTHGFAMLCIFHVDAAAGRGELDGVGHEIRHHLQHAAGVEGCRQPKFGGRHIQ